MASRPEEEGWRDLEDAWSEADEPRATPRPAGDRHGPKGWRDGLSLRLLRWFFSGFPRWSDDAPATPTDTHASDHDDDRGTDEPAGWKDPDPRPRRPGRRLKMRILQFPARLAGWFVGLCLLWVAAYIWIDPPFWTYLNAEEARLGDTTHFDVPLEEVSPHLVRAVMAAEDARFCEHWGVDLDALRDVWENWDRGERVRGASTITQQTAKNVFLWQDRSWLRKGMEAGFTLAIEGFWSKRRIMEVYLNVAEFDEGVFGAEAAARNYFGKKASQLTLREASLLAAVLPDPKDRSASRPTGRLSQRARAIADGAATLERTGRDACVLD